MAGQKRPVWGGPVPKIPQNWGESPSPGVRGRLLFFFNLKGTLSPPCLLRKTQMGTPNGRRAAKITRAPEPERLAPRRPVKKAAPKKRPLPQRRARTSYGRSKRRAWLFPAGAFSCRQHTRLNTKRSHGAEGSAGSLSGPGSSAGSFWAEDTSRPIGRCVAKRRGH